MQLKWCFIYGRPLLTALLFGPTFNWHLNALSVRNISTYIYSYMQIYIFFCFCILHNFYPRYAAKAFECAHKFPFALSPPADRRTDRQTDRQTDVQSGSQLANNYW